MAHICQEFGLGPTGPFRQVLGSLKFGFGFLSHRQVKNKDVHPNRSSPALFQKRRFHLNGELTAALTIVENLARMESIASHQFQKRRQGTDLVRGAENTQLLADQLVRLVAVHLGHPRIGEDNLAVEIRAGNALRRLLDHHAETMRFQPQCLPGAYIAQYDDDPGNLVVLRNRDRRDGYGTLPPVAGDHGRKVRIALDTAAAQDLRYDILSRNARVLIDDVENGLQWPPQNPLGTMTGQRFSRGVHESDVRGAIHGDDGFAHIADGHPEMFCFPKRNVPFCARDAATSGRGSGTTADHPADHAADNQSDQKTDHDRANGIAQGRHVKRACKRIARWKQQESCHKAENSSKG